MSKEIVINPKNEKFILLCDFLDSFSKMKFDIDHDIIMSDIILPFRENLKKFIPNLMLIELDEIRKQIARKVDERYFVITMDDGTYFQNFDFNFNITRTAYEIANVKSGPYFRIPRTQGRNIISQGQLLLDLYTKLGNKKPIALCDDGVGTGGSLKKILNILNELKIHPTKLFVYLNPNNLDSIGNNDIDTIFKIEEPYNWLSERDLFWGIPRSGVNCKINIKDKDYQVGIPYTIDRDMIINRIADFGYKTDYFRELCLNINIELWGRVQSMINKDLLMKDFDRLNAFAVKKNMKIDDYINSINNPNYKL
jgi:hypothetical protein